MYNFNKYRFMTRKSSTSTQGKILEEMKSKEVIKTSQEGKIKWISVLAAVYEVAIKILLVLIYQKESQDLKHG